MRLIHVVVLSSGAKRILEIGYGLGHSAPWLADASGSNGTLDTIEGDPSRVELVTEQIDSAGLADRITVHTGEADEVPQGLAGPFDLHLRRRVAHRGSRPS